MAFPPALMDLPSPLVEKVKNLYRIQGLVLIVSKPRKTKLGDCRVKSGGSGIITINSGMTPLQTFMTMIHELAHYRQFTRHGWKGKLEPHGAEWKSEYKKLMDEFFGFGYFDPETEKNIMSHMENPTARSCADTTLVKTLNPGETIVSDLSIGTMFFCDFKLYTVVQKLRKNYKCRCVATGDMFIFPPTYRVKI